MRGAFHIVTLAGDTPGEVRRRVQQDTTGHRGRKGDPLYQIRLLLRASRHKLPRVNKNDSVKPGPVRKLLTVCLCGCCPGRLV